MSPNGLLEPPHFLQPSFYRLQIDLQSYFSFFCQEIAEMMRTFSTFSSTRKLMIEVAAFTLDPGQIDSAREAFEAVDTDGSGTIEFDEVDRLFR